MGTVASFGAMDNHIKKDYDAYTRRAYHAGSWYEDDEKSLSATLDQFLQNVEKDGAISNSNHEQNGCLESELRGLICPHAGYSYSGPTAGYSYYELWKELQKPSSKIKRIVVLHPSHHVYIKGCAVSGATCLETPLGDLFVDDELRKQILSLSSNNETFSVMNASMDNKEHSGEMQYPFIAKAIGKQNLQNIKVLPIMCGAISTKQEQIYGSMLSKILSNPEILTIVSTDFCHWGSRFSYQPTPSGTATETMPIFEYIKEMDHQGMSLIEMQQPGAFADYLKRTQNTICGRHPISVYLNAITTNKSDNNLDVKFIKYAQSSAVQSIRESSVSYASAVVTKRS